MKSFLLAVASLLYVSNGANAWCAEYNHCMATTCLTNANAFCGSSGNTKGVAFTNCVDNYKINTCPIDCLEAYNHCFNNPW